MTNTQSPQVGEQDQEHAEGRPDGAGSHVCAICVEQIDGTPHREQLDPGGPLYVVCEVCATEHPRSGRYSFDDRGKEHDAISPRLAGRGRGAGLVDGQGRVGAPTRGGR